jgi:hypothetical protein
VYYSPMRRQRVSATFYPPALEKWRRASERAAVAPVNPEGTCRPDFGCRRPGVRENTASLIYHVAAPFSEHQVQYLVTDPEDTASHLEAGTLPGT